MTDQPSKSPAEMSAHRPTTAKGVYAPLTGRWLNLSRAVWLIATLPMLGISAAGITPRYRQLMGDTALVGDALQTLNITPAAYTIYFMVIAFLLVAFFAVPAIFVYVRRQQDWVALLSSLVLMSIGTVSSNFPNALALETPSVAVIADFMRALSEGLPIILLFVFPTGKSQPRWTRYLAMFYLVFILITPLVYGTALHQSAWPALVAGLWLAFWFILAVVSQAYRYLRISTKTQKQQSKWIVVGGGIAAIVFVALRVARGLFPVLAAPGTPAGVIWLAV